MQSSNSNRLSDRLVIHRGSPVVKHIMMINVALLFITLLSGCASTTTAEETARKSDVPKSKDTLTIQLVSINGSFYGVKHHRLAQKIELFHELNPKTDISIRWIHDYNLTLGSDTVPSWIRTAKPAELYTDAEDVPDIFELAPNQMLELYRRGAIEPLNMNETAVSEYMISTNDGYVLGIKSKINPMIVYYNKQVFESLGLDPPSNQWDWEKLNNTIVKLRAAGETVYIPLNPYTLEWSASLNGRRIAAVDGVTYRGYLDSDEAIKGAEWLIGIGTKYREKVVNGIIPPAMPFDLLDGEIALAIDYASVGDPNNYEVISQRNEHIGITGLPTGTDGVNPSHISGLSLASRSKNKELAIKLLQYLMEDKNLLYSDIADYTLQSNMKPLAEPVSIERKTFIINEMKRSVPALLFMHEAFSMPYFDQWSSPKPLSAIHNGGPIREALHQYAMELEQEWIGHR